MGFLSSIFGGSNSTLDSDIKKLGSLAGYETGIGEADTTAASQYYTDILSGDQSRINKALAPQISAGQNMVQQTAGQNAQFGTRSGGTTASTAGAQAANRGNIINQIGGLQSTAASGASNLGTSNLGMASSNTQAQAKESEEQQNSFMNSILGKGVGVAAGTAESAGLDKLFPGASTDGQ